MKHAVTGFFAIVFLLFAVTVVAYAFKHDSFGPVTMGFALGSIVIGGALALGTDMKQAIDTTTGGVAKAVRAARGDSGGGS